MEILGVFGVVLMMIGFAIRLYNDYEPPTSNILKVAQIIIVIGVLCISIAILTYTV